MGRTIFERAIWPRIQETARLYPVTLVTGARQVGKSFLVSRFKDIGYDYRSLDMISERMEAEAAPENYVARLRPKVVLDEIQKAPSLFEAIAGKVNEARLKDPSSAQGLFILTGSQSFRLMKGVKESLAGRVGIIEMEGLSRSEILGRETIPLVEDGLPSLLGPERATTPLGEGWIAKGSFPEPWSIEMDQRQLDDYYENYISTVVLRDIPEYLRTRNADLFLRFLKDMARRCGQELNTTQVASDISISPNTASSWLEALEAVGMIYLLPPLPGTKIGSAVSSRKKLYFKDTGLALALSGTRRDMPRDPSVKGPYFENYVVGEVRKGFLNAGISLSAFHYVREKGGAELDLAIVSGNRLIPVEIKSTSRLEASLAYLEKKKMPRLPGWETRPLVLISNLDHPVSLSDGSKILPAASL